VPEILRLAASEWADRASSLRSEGWVATDLCGLDRLGLVGDGARFEVVVQLLHMETRRRLTVHVAAEGDPPTVPSAIGVWPAVDFPEREAYDLVGIHFDGHPNLRRIMMPDEWEGHPLRKDYGVGKVPVEFRPQPFLQIDAPGQATTSVHAAREVDHLGQPVPGDDTPARRESNWSRSGAAEGEAQE
jgi:NADH-quinone oxidoreductase subunit C